MCVCVLECCVLAQEFKCHRSKRRDSEPLQIVKGVCKSSDLYTGLKLGSSEKQHVFLTIDPSLLHAYFFILK